MGYYSTLRADSLLPVQITSEEFNRRWREAINETRGTTYDGYLDFYSWVPVDGASGYYLLEMDDDDWYAKHYADRRLAEFVSRVIAPRKYFLMEFDGEDGDRWGYFIRSGSVEEIAYVRMVGSRPLNDVIEEISG